MVLRLGIDARTLLLDQPTGVERVAYHFVESLRRVAPDDLECSLFFDAPPPPELLRRLPGEVVVVPVKVPSLQHVADLWLALQMRAAAQRHRLDAFVSFNTKFPLFRGGVFTTVHGLEWYFCPHEYRAVEKLKQWVWFQLCTRMSRGLITFAQHTAQDIRRVRPGCALPTLVVPEGVAPQFRRLGAAELDPAVLARRGVRGPFVLSVCSLEPRKNIAALIRAFALAVREHDLPHQLVLVGRAGWKSEQLHSEIREAGVLDRVVLTGYVTDDELVQAYNQAEVFVYPSKYEGFGLPVVEAMACGAPVVTSDRTATREVAGAAALLVDPDSERSLADGLALCLTEPTRRAQLAEAGCARAREFSWDAMTREILAFVEQTLRPDERALWRESGS